MPSTRRIKESKDVTIYEEDITTNDKAAEMQVVVSIGANIKIRIRCLRSE